MMRATSPTAGAQQQCGERSERQRAGDARDPWSPAIPRTSSTAPVRPSSVTPGDFVDDDAVDMRLRNDLGLPFLIEIDARGRQCLEAVPLELDHCHTRLARGEDAEWIHRRFIAACAELGTQTVADDGRVVVARSRARGQDPVARVDRVDDPN
jgi:hypothetical protein